MNITVPFLKLDNIFANPLQLTLTFKKTGHLKIQEK